MKNIIFDCNYPRKVAIVENDMLVEYYEERKSNRSIVGNIYKAKVMSIHTGIQAAFVDIGFEKNAFLYWDDVLPKFIGMPSQLIQDNISVGQEILVQITKDAYADKGPRCTMKITLPGKYAVLAFDSNYIALSQKIINPINRERLKNLALFYKTRAKYKFGIIIRTEAENQIDTIILDDINRLYGKMCEIINLAQKGKVPRCLYGEEDFIEKMCREKLTSDVDRVVINDEFVYNNLIKEKRMVDSMQNIMLNLYTHSYDIFAFYKLTRQIQSINARIITLDCGASIVFDKTEAMTVVDVNSGVYQGGKNLEQNLFKVNIEAALEIARQIRLRDIGGIIIIDFLNMKEESSNELLVQTFKNAFVDDKAKNYIGEISKLGLLEMSRQRTMNN